MWILLLHLAAWAAPARVQPVPATDLVLVRPIELTAPWRFTWSAVERPVDRATLIVLRTPAALGAARQGPQPTLFVGAEPAEILARDAGGTCLLVLAPDTFRPGPIYWGPDVLPEVVNPELGLDLLAEAQRAGITPPSVSSDAPRRLPALNPRDKALLALLDRCGDD